MPYAQEVNRTHKALFVLLIDQSLSMADPSDDGASTRAIAVARVITGWLSALVCKSYRGDDIRDWLDLAVIGFRTNDEGSPVVESAIAGDLAGRDRVSIKEVSEHCLVASEATSMPSVAGGLETPSPEAQCPYWITAIAEGGTPTCTALARAQEICRHWIEEHPDSFPPVVILVTDGESSEGDPQPYAESLTSLCTSDGNVLLFTCDIDSSHDPGEKRNAEWFPDSSQAGSDERCRSLISMSSRLPEAFLGRIRSEWDPGVRVSAESRGCLLHGGLSDLQRLLGLLIPGDVGTRPVTDSRSIAIAPPNRPMFRIEEGSPYLDDNVQFTTYCPSRDSGREVHATAGVRPPRRAASRRPPRPARTYGGGAATGPGALGGRDQQLSTEHARESAGHPPRERTDVRRRVRGAEVQSSPAHPVLGGAGPSGRVSA